MSKINLLSWLTFLLRSLSLTHSAALLDLFFPSDAGICSTNTDLLLCTYKFWSYCCLSFYWSSIKLKTGCPILSPSIWQIFCWLEWCPWSFEGVFMILLLLVSLLTKFRLELMYILLIVSILPSFTHLRRFPAACAAAILHGNHVFCIYQQDKFFECDVKLRQTSNHCTRINEAAKFAYANKTEE